MKYCTLSIWAVVFITFREQSNNQRLRCDIAWLHVTSHLYHGFPSLMVQKLNHGINITYFIFFICKKKHRYQFSVHCKYGIS